MIRSMTAFARQDMTAEFGAISWELRCVNHRYLEPSLRLPEAFRALEPQVRERIGRRLGRGKLECCLSYKPASAEARLVLDNDLARRLVALGTEVSHLIINPGRMSPLDILRWPGVLENPAPDLEQLADEVLDLLDRALDELVQTREREGGKLKQALEERCQAMRVIVTEVRSRLPEILAGLRQRLQERFAELQLQLDEARLEQEMVLLTQRLDVEEELKRLEMHIEEVLRILAADDGKPVGRRLDFLMQELNREANTLCSKSMDSETTRAGIDLKVYIEQMREQVQNIE